MPRPERLVVVTGTGTEVGKTWVTGTLAGWLISAGATVAARKPAQSFAPDDATTDASVLAEATGVDPEVVCRRHRWYPVPLAPPMAADALGWPPIILDELVAELDWPPVDVGFVEGAGGLCSPIAHDGDTLGLIDRLEPDAVVLVADPALGVVSDVRLAARALGATALVVMLNRYDAADEVHRRSAEWLSEADGLTLVTDVAAAGRFVLAAAPGPRPEPLA